MGVLSALEKPLEQLNSKLPKLPKETTSAIAKVASWLAVLGAVLSALIVYRRWDDINDLNKAKDALDKLRESFGSYSSSFSDVASSSTGSASTKLWILLIIAAASTVLFVLAFKGLQAFKKQGWDYAVLALLASLVYVIVYLFISEFEFGEIFLHLVVVLAGLYVALQIKDYFNGKEKVSPVTVKDSTPQAPTATPPADKL